MHYIVNRDVRMQVYGSNCDNINLDNNFTGGCFVMIIIIMSFNHSTNSG